MKKILILYHSGAGSTETICEIYRELLNDYDVSMGKISLEYDYDKLKIYDLIIFAFPVYHAECSKSMSNFIDKMPKFNEAKRGFVISTFGLFNCNATMHFIKKAASSNLLTIGFSGYRSPASDGALLLPGFSFMYSYEKRIAIKIKKDIDFIRKSFETDNINERCPRFKFYSILNFPNKFFGQRFAPSFYIDKNKCVNCNNCVKDCIRGCFSRINEELKFNKEKCEHCYRCIHHCPTSAIYLSKNTFNRKKLNRDFYKRLKENILNEI